MGGLDEPGDVGEAGDATSTLASAMDASCAALSELLPPPHPASHPTSAALAHPIPRT